jgi:hypothetical protein
MPLNLRCSRSSQSISSLNPFPKLMDTIVHESPAEQYTQKVVRFLRLSP